MFSTHLLLFSLLVCVSPFVGVSACEGECIVAITKAFLGNYSSPIHDVLRGLGEQVSTQLLPPSQRPTDPITLMQPIFTAYQNVSYDSLETAIFPSYFHGKCQRFSKDGQDPPGCPDPDCPVVCGTPGSLVHFYPTLRFIAFNDTRDMMVRLVKPGQKTYEAVANLVSDAQKQKRNVAMHERDYIDTETADNFPDGRSQSHGHVYGRSAPAHSHHFSPLSRQRTVPQPHVQRASISNLESILALVGSELEKACGGDANDSESGLPNCSWEADMKKYILSFN
ncbi:hypothetical protein M0805_002234 [Coniferiporia weirii]|nr:hypothetical protein M0805_002234 [Coniferiporia weirii]